jgi:hypothetical protein
MFSAIIIAVALAMLALAMMRKRPAIRSDDEHARESIG